MSNHKKSSSSPSWSAGKQNLVSAAKPIGFALATITVFIAGMIWEGHRQEASRVERAKELASPQIKEIGTQRNTNPIPSDFFPATEFRPQAGILLGCYDRIQTIPNVYVDIARVIDGRLPLYGLVANETQLNHALKIMNEAGIPEGNMKFVIVPGNTIWVRDYAPFILRSRDNSVIMVDAKYQSRNDRDDRSRDEHMALALSSLLNIPVRSIPLMLEGGNLLSSGDGNIITSTITLDLNLEFRFDEDHVADLMNDFLGVENAACLAPLENEPTGHVDQFVALLKTDLAVVAKADPSAEPINSRRLDLSAQYVSQITTSQGPVQVHRIPTPPRWNLHWRTYTNIILANGILLMPSYSDVDPALEDEAETLYRKLMPGWEVKRINCDPLVKQEGYLRCISYNVPAFVSLERLNEVALPKTKQRNLYN